MKRPSVPLIPTEHAEQAALFEWIGLMAKRHRAFRTIFAIPNGGWRHKVTARILQAEGVQPGVPDIFCAFPSRKLKKHGLFIELKRADGTASDVRPSQRDWGDRLRSHGYAVVVCFGEKEARKAICTYLDVADIYE